MCVCVCVCVCACVRACVHACVRACVLSFWYQLTRVVLEKGLLSGCVCVWFETGLLRLRPESVTKV